MSRVHVARSLRQSVLIHLEEIVGIVVARDPSGVESVAGYCASSASRAFARHRGCQRWEQG